MNLSELYNEALNENNVWKKLESILSTGEVLNEEIGGGLDKLLTEANKVIFDKFKINPKDKKYFISGSARLYLYPDLIAELNKMDPRNFPLYVGDLDMVIPDKQLWINAGLSDLLKTGIYRPYILRPPITTMNIEAFTVWAPNRTPGYENIEVRSEQEIFNNLEFIHGYWFMGLQDVIDYKDVMKRDKEKALSNMIKQYEQSGEERDLFLKRVASILTGKYQLNK
jgi:hypothetical protein